MPDTKPTLQSRAWSRITAIHRAPIGAPPGTLVSNPDALKPTIHVVSYDADELEESDIGLEAIDEWHGRRTVTWVDVAGLGDADTVRRMGDIFGLHPLALEDVLSTGQRPKVEEYDDHLYIVTRIVVPGDRFQTEQISIFAGDNYVVTFQERVGDCFDPVRRRIERAKGRIRHAGADYLAYALLDAVVDHFAPVVDQYGQRLEELEETVLRGKAPNIVTELLGLRHDLQLLRRVAHPLYRSLEDLQDPDLAVITEETSIYLRDTHDHAARLIDAAEGWRDFSANLMDVHLAVSSHELNAVMKVLTMISTIFIPLGFLAGLYGMNFNPEVSPFNMPELNWYLGYPFVLTIMCVMVMIQLFFFHRVGWIGKPK